MYMIFMHIYSRTPTSNCDGTGVGSKVVITVIIVGSSVVGRGVGRLVGGDDMGGNDGDGVGGSVSWNKTWGVEMLIFEYVSVEL
jgi:hypothetical protein